MTYNVFSGTLNQVLNQSYQLNIQRTITKEVDMYTGAVHEVIKPLG